MDPIGLVLEGLGMRLTVRRPAPGFFVLLAAAAVAALVLSSSFLTSPPFAQSTDSPPAVAMDIAATVAQVRVNKPIPVTATLQRAGFRLYRGRHYRRQRRCRQLCRQRRRRRIYF